MYGPGDYEAFPITHHLDPRNDFEGVSEETARSIACDEMMVTPEFIANDLVDECLGYNEPVSVLQLSDDMTTLNIPQLLALIMDGLDAQCLAARHELKQRIIEANQWFINQRATEIMEAE